MKQNFSFLQNGKGVTKNSSILKKRFTWNLIKLIPSLSVGREGRERGKTPNKNNQNKEAQKAETFFFQPTLNQSKFFTKKTRSKMKFALQSSSLKKQKQLGLCTRPKTDKQEDLNTQTWLFYKNPSFFPTKKGFMQFWVFPFIGMTYYLYNTRFISDKPGSFRASISMDKLKKSKKLFPLLPSCESLLPVLREEPEPLWGKKELDESEGRRFNTFFRKTNNVKSFENFNFLENPLNSFLLKDLIAKNYLFDHTSALKTFINFNLYNFNSPLLKKFDRIVKQEEFSKSDLKKPLKSVFSRICIEDKNKEKKNTKMEKVYLQKKCVSTLNKIVLLKTLSNRLKEQCHFYEKSTTDKKKMLNQKFKNFDSLQEKNSKEKVSENYFQMLLSLKKLQIQKKLEHNQNLCSLENRPERVKLSGALKWQIYEISIFRSLKSSKSSMKHLSFFPIPPIPPSGMGGMGGTKNQKNLCFLVREGFGLSFSHRESNHNLINKQEKLEKTLKEKKNNNKLNYPFSNLHFLINNNISIKNIKKIEIQKKTENLKFQQAKIFRLEEPILMCNYLNAVPHFTIHSTAPCSKEAQGAEEEIKKRELARKTQIEFSSASAKQLQLKNQITGFDTSLKLGLSPLENMSLSFLNPNSFSGAVPDFKNLNHSNPLDFLNGTSFHTIFNFSFYKAKNKMDFTKITKTNRNENSIGSQTVSSQIVWILNTMNDQLLKTKNRIFSLNQKRPFYNFQSLRQTSNLKHCSTFQITVTKARKLSENKTQKSYTFCVYKNGSLEKRFKNKLQFKCKAKMSSFKKRVFDYKTNNAKNKTLGNRKQEKLFRTYLSCKAMNFVKTQGLKTKNSKNYNLNNYVPFSYTKKILKQLKANTKKNVGKDYKKNQHLLYQINNNVDYFKKQKIDFLSNPTTIVDSVKNQFSVLKECPNHSRNSLNNLLRRIGFLFVYKKELERSYTQESSLTNPVIHTDTSNRIEKHRSQQKKRRRKKQKRFYPRPMWMRFLVYKNFLVERFYNVKNSLKLKNQKDVFNHLSKEKKSIKTAQFENTQTSYSQKWLKTTFFKKILKRKKQNHVQQSTNTSFFLLNFPNYLKKTKLHESQENSQLFQEKNLLKRNSYHDLNDLGKESSPTSFIPFTNQNLLRNGIEEPMFKSQNFYQISNRVMTDFQRLCWKSYWLRASLTPYIKRVQNSMRNLNPFVVSKTAQSSEKFKASKRNDTLGFGQAVEEAEDWNSAHPKNIFKNTKQNQKMAFQNFEENILQPLYYLNLKTGDHIKNAQFSFFQNIQEKVEYERILYDRISDIIQNEKINLNKAIPSSAYSKKILKSGHSKNLNEIVKTNSQKKEQANQGKLGTKSYKLGRSKKENLFLRQPFSLNLSKNLIKDKETAKQLSIASQRQNHLSFWYRFGFFLNNELNNPLIRAFSLNSKMDFSIKPFGHMPTLRTLWALNQTNLLGLPNPKRKQTMEINRLWSYYKIRDLNSSNKTKKFFSVLSNSFSSFKNKNLSQKYKKLNDLCLKKVQLLTKKQNYLGTNTFKTKCSMFVLKLKENSFLQNAQTMQVKKQIKRSIHFWWEFPARTQEMEFSKFFLTDSIWLDDFLSSSFQKKQEKQNISVSSTSATVWVPLLTCTLLFHLCTLFSLIQISEVRSLTKFYSLIFYKFSNVYFILIYSIFHLFKHYKNQLCNFFLSLKSKSPQKFYKNENPNKQKESSKFLFYGFPNLQLHSLPLRQNPIPSPITEGERIEKLQQNEKIKNLPKTLFFLEMPYRFGAGTFKRNQILNNYKIQYVQYEQNKNLNPTDVGYGQKQINNFRINLTPKDLNKNVNLVKLSKFVKLKFFKKSPFRLRKFFSILKGFKKNKNQFFPWILPSPWKIPILENQIHSKLAFYLPNVEMFKIQPLNSSLKLDKTKTKKSVFKRRNSFLFYASKNLKDCIYSFLYLDFKTHDFSQQISFFSTLNSKKFKKTAQVFYLYGCFSFLSATKLSGSFMYELLKLGSFFLFKIIDLFESFIFIIYKFLEKPAELLIDWIAQLFLVEWSSDVPNFVPELFDIYNWNSVFKFSRGANIVPGIGFLLQRRFYTFFEIFLNLIWKPDSDLKMRQRKGTIFWDIWAEILMIAAEKYGIQLTSLTTVKEEQDAFLERLLNDEKWLSFQKHQENSKVKPEKKMEKQEKALMDLELMLAVGEKMNSWNLENTVQHHSKKENFEKLLCSFFYPGLKNQKNDSLGHLKKTNKNLNRQTLETFFLSLESHDDRIKKINFETNWKMWQRWETNQHSIHQATDTDLFIEIHPPKSFAYSNHLAGSGVLKSSTPKNSKGIPGLFTLGLLTCEIYAGLFSKQVSKNILVVTSPGNRQNQLIQALAGETELKFITDNAYRYANVQKGIAVGMKLLRDVFDGLTLHTPCLFLMEDIHIIGERRSMLISDNENVKATENAFTPETEEIHEKNQFIYQLNKHSILDYKRPYKGDFSLLIPTNHFCFDLFLGVSAPKIRKLGITPKSPLNTGSFSLLSKEAFTSGKENNQENSNKKSTIFRSLLQKSSQQFFAPPATSPFLVLGQRNQPKIRQIVKEMPWGGFSNDQLMLVPKLKYSIRAKIAVLVDFSLNQLSVKLDMITDLLVIMDNVRSNYGFVIFATTHIPFVLDPALRRPGRLDQTISLPFSTTLIDRFNIFKLNFTNFTSTIDFFSYSFSLQNLNETNLSSLINQTKLLLLNMNEIFKFQKKMKNQLTGLNYSEVQQNIKNTNKVLKNHRQYFLNKNLIQNMNSALALNLKSENLDLYKIKKKLQKTKKRNLQPLNQQSNPLQNSMGSSMTKGQNWNQLENNSLLMGLKNQRSTIIFPCYSTLGFTYASISKFLIQSQLLKDTRYSHFTLNSIENLIQTVPSGEGKEEVYKNISSSFYKSSPHSFYEKTTLKNSVLLASSKKQEHNDTLEIQNNFQTNLMFLLSGKAGEFLFFNYFSRLQKIQKAKQPKNGTLVKKVHIKKPLTNSLKAALIHPNFQTGSWNLFNLSSISKQRFIQNPNNPNECREIKEFWSLATSFVFDFIQKRHLYNNKLLTNRLLYCTDISMLKEPPSPSASMVLMPSKKYENLKRTERDFQQKGKNSILDKIHLHQQQRFMKNLYKRSNFEKFRSETVQNRLTSFNSSVKELGYYDSFMRKSSSIHYLYKNRVLNRQQFSFVNQWWNGQLAEHNLEKTYSSDVDWRSMFVESFGDLVIDFPDADQYYNPKLRRWFLQSTYGGYWQTFEKTIPFEIYQHFILLCFNRALNYLGTEREILDFLAYAYLQKGNFKEIDFSINFSRFYIFKNA